MGFCCDTGAMLLHYVAIFMSRVLFALLSCFALYFGTNLVPPPPCRSPCVCLRFVAAFPVLAKFAQFLRFGICTNYILLFYSFTICRPSAAIKLAFAVVAH